MLGDADELAVVKCNGLKDEDFDCYPLRDTEGATMVGELLGTTAETSELVVARIGVQLRTILGQRQGRLVQARVGKSQNLA